MLSMYVLPRYSPNIPIPINCTPPKKVTAAKVEAYPGTSIPLVNVAIIVFNAKIKAIIVITAPI